MHALTSLLQTASDEALYVALCRLEPKPIAIAVRLLPVERTNTLLAAMPAEKAATILELAADDAAPSASDLRLLERALSREPGGAVLRVLDLVARAVGAFRKVPGAPARGS